MTEAPHPAGPTGSVLLDIGGDVGALVVSVDDAYAGHEIEARPAGHRARPAHASVLRRTTAVGTAHAAVIPGLVAGAYTLWLDAATPWGYARVQAGIVTEVDRCGVCPAPSRS